MNGLRILPSLVLLGAASTSMAEDIVRYDYARVINVRPIYESRVHTTPQQECWNERVVERRSGSDSATGAVLGGIIGAAVGNELGHGNSNKQVGAVAGALLGASVGHDLSKKERPPRHYHEERCRTVYQEQREEYISGYRVKYHYNGRNYVTQTPYHPGESLKLEVRITPVS